MDGELAAALKFLISAVEGTGPITISTAQTQTWFIFTDGAYEPSASEPGTIGGLLVDQWGHSREYFGLAIPQTLLAQFMEESDHPIYELELLPVVVAIRLWSQLLLRTHTVFYLDNTAAHSALVRADGATKAAKTMVLEFVRYENFYTCCLGLEECPLTVIPQTMLHA